MAMMIYVLDCLASLLLHSKDKIVLFEPRGSYDGPDISVPEAVIQSDTGLGICFVRYTRMLVYCAGMFTIPVFSARIPTNGRTS